MIITIRAKQQRLLGRDKLRDHGTVRIYIMGNNNSSSVTLSYRLIVATEQQGGIAKHGWTCNANGLEHFARQRPTHGTNPAGSSTRQVGRRDCACPPYDAVWRSCVQHRTDDDIVGTHPCLFSVHTLNTALSERLEQMAVEFVAPVADAGMTAGLPVVHRQRAETGANLPLLADRGSPRTQPLAGCPPHPSGGEPGDRRVKPTVAPGHAWREQRARTFLQHGKRAMSRILLRKP